MISFIGQIVEVGIHGIPGIAILLRTDVHK